MEKGLRENTKEENMEDDGGGKMRRRRYETETRVRYKQEIIKEK